MLGTLPPSNSLEWIQGSPEDLHHPLRLALLMQPNCPGCHSHALPVANELFSMHNFDVYCISTAFEDFEFNTPDSVRTLLQGELVGIPRQRLGPKAAPIAMPIAHDIVVDKDKASPELMNLAIEATREQVTDQLQRGNMPRHVVQQALSKLDSKMLPHKIAHVFYAARAQGTPTWILHHPDGKIIDTVFGSSSKEDLLTWINAIAEELQVTQSK